MKKIKVALILTLVAVLAIGLGACDFSGLFGNSVTEPPPEAEAPPPQGSTPPPVATPVPPIGTLPEYETPVTLPDTISPRSTKRPSPQSAHCQGTRHRSHCQTLSLRSTQRPSPRSAHFQGTGQRSHCLIL